MINDFPPLIYDNRSSRFFYARIIIMLKSRA